jgi:hypothetical protein
MAIFCHWRTGADRADAGFAITARARDDISQLKRVFANANHTGRLVPDLSRQANIKLTGRHPPGSSFAT